jgi:site-specific recombinase XerD
VRAYQLYLIAQQRPWSHINQVVCALRFFYGITLGRSDANEQIVAAREPQRLPVVLSGDEIARFLEAVPGLRNRVALTTAYGAALRVGEVVHLTAAAINSSRTGGKDRYVMLSSQPLQILRTYGRLARKRSAITTPVLTLPRIDDDRIVFFQVHGSSADSSLCLVRPDTIRSRTSVNQASASTSFSFAVWISVATIAQ